MNTKDTNIKEMKEAINSFELSFENSKLPFEIELIPSEDMFVGFDGRVFRAIDKIAIVNNTNSKLKYVVIDENHKTDYTNGTGQSAEAMGWMFDFFVKDDNSIWAKVEWTKAGAEKILNKEYKYISPVYQIDKSTNIISILRAAITNNPNLNLTALNNKLENKNINKKGDNMPEELKEEWKREVNEIKVELNCERENNKSLKTKNEELEKALNEANEKLGELKKSFAEKEALSIVEKAINEGKIAPSTREVYIALCMEENGIERFNKIMESTPKAGIFKEFKEFDSNNILDTKIELNETDKSLAKAMGYSEKEYLSIQEKA